MSLTIGSDAQGVDSVTYAGQWCIAGQQDKWVAGTLYVEPGEIRLELLGGLEVDREDQADQIVHGSVEKGVQVTLAMVMVVSESYAESVTHQSWIVADCYLGAWISRPRDAIFTGVSVATELLSHWAPVRANVSQTKGSLTAAVSVPDAKSVRVEGLGQVTFGWSKRTAVGTNGTNIAIIPEINVAFDSPVTEEGAWRSAVAPSVHLTGLVYGLPDRVTRLRLFVSGVPDPSSLEVVEWIGTSWARPIDSNARRRPSFEVSELLGNFEDAVGAWFQLALTRGVALRRFFSIYTDAPSFVEESFERVVRAVEVWHREEQPGHLVEESTFVALVARWAGVDSEWSEFIEARLKFANEMTLKKRLDDVIVQAGEPVASFVQEVPRFVRKTVNTRNSLVHRAEPGESFTLEQLAVANYVWRSAFVAILLRKLGFGDAQVTYAVERSHGWQFVRASVFSR